MKKELDFIRIDGAYGGDQNWFSDRFMRLAGCSAVCASEACAYLAGRFPNLSRLYPGDPRSIRKEEFVSFMQSVYQYITPGFMGMSSIKRFKKCFTEYAYSVGADVRILLLGGDAPAGEAKRFLTRALDADYCALYLLLTHKDPEMDEFTWHWFTLTGYEMNGETIMVDFATWGKKHTLPFEKLWNTGTLSRGGMVLVTDPSDGAFAGV